MYLIFNFIGKTNIFISIGPVPGGTGSVWACLGCIRWLRAEAERVTPSGPQVSVGVVPSTVERKNQEERLLEKVIAPKADWLFG